MNTSKKSAKYRKFGRAVWSLLRDRYPWYADEGDDDIMILAGKCGLCERVEYDPKKHGETDADVGNMIWYWGR